MKIAMVSEHASPLAVLGGADGGGQNVHVDALARALARRGHDLVVHTRRDSARLPPRVRLDPGVSVHHVSAGPARPTPKDELLPYMATFAEELAAEWRAAPPDLVHAHFWMSGLASVAAAAELGVPFVVTFHALGSQKRRHQGTADTSPVERVPAERSLLRDCDHVVATAAAEVDELVAMGGRREQISVVPCGVDLAHFRPDGPAAPRTPGRQRLLCLGRLVPRKGVEDVIRSLVALPDAELVVAGGPPREHLASDPEARRLAGIAADLGVRDRVDLRGAVDRAGAPTLIRSADVVVCVPWYEPFGIVPLEAMACGRPVVGSAVGGLLDSIVPGATGVLVPPQRPHHLSRVLGDLLADPDRRQRLGRAGATRARSRYSWDQIALEHERVYSGLLAHVGAVEVAR
jgi:glycosyltransferase involved in cell wall biosynthesis